MKPLRKPMWRSGSSAGWLARRCLRVSTGRSKSSHSLTRRWSLPVCSRSSRTRKSCQSEKSWTEVTPWASASAMARLRAARRSSGLGGGILLSTRARAAPSRMIPVGVLFVGPDGVVPASALEPGAGFCGVGVGFDALLHLGEGFCVVEVDGEFLLAGGGDVGVGDVEAGHGEGAVQVDDLCLGSLCFEHVGVGACGQDFAVGDGEGGYLCRGEGGVVGAEVSAGKDVAVDIDGVGRRCLVGLGVGQGCEQDGEEGQGFHETECTKGRGLAWVAIACVQVVRLHHPIPLILRKIFYSLWIAWYFDDAGCASKVQSIQNKTDT